MIKNYDPGLSLLRVDLIYSDTFVLAEQYIYDIYMKL